MWNAQLQTNTYFNQVTRESSKKEPLAMMRGDKRWVREGLRRAGARL